MSEWWSSDPVSGPPALDTRSRDYAIRTVFGEAGQEPDIGQAAVAHVIRNRMDAGRYGGTTVPQVVLAKNQFEPWGNAQSRAKMMALGESDPAYQSIGNIVDQVFTGGIADPTNGATHFVSPGAQAALGRQMPSWAQGEGQAIGRHTFYAPEGRVQRASDNWWAGDPVADQGGQFMAPLPDGGNARVAREGMSEPAPPPLTFGEKLAKAWENPAPNGLMGMVKSAVSGAALPGDVYSGATPIRDEGGRTNPEVIQRSLQLAQAVPMSAAPGGIAAAPVGQGLAKAAPIPERVVPTSEELIAAGKQAFKSPEVKNLEVQPQAISGWATGLRNDLTNQGLGADTAAGVDRLLAGLEKAPSGSFTTGDNLQGLRRTFGQMAKEKQPTGDATPNAAAASQAMRKLDDFVQNMDQAAVRSGDPQAAANMWQQGRADYAAGKLSQSVDNKAVAAELRAAAANSGQNVANTIRSRMATAALKPGGLSGMNEAERAMVDEIIRGTAGQNAIRFGGKVLGGGGGLGALVTGAVGGALGGPMGYALPALGYGLNAISNRMTMQQAAKLSEAIRSRAPLANAMNDFGARAQEYSRAQTPRAIAGLSIAARNLSNNLRDAGIYLSPADIMRSLTGSAKIAAQPDQQQ